MDFKEYIQGKRRGKAANELEREALNDPFLQDAIDGFDSVPGEHLSIIEQLEKQITGKQKHRSLWWIGIAASVVLIIGIGILISPENETNFVTEKATKKIEKTAISIDKQEVVTENNSIKTIAVHTQKRKLKSIVSDTNKVVIDEISIVETTDNITQSNNFEAQVSATIQPDTDTNKTEVLTRILATAPKPIYKITGVVYDEEGKPLAGANVKFENSYKGVVTDLHGKFELPANKNSDQLKISYIGYNEKKISVDSEKISVQLEPNNLALNEVVVVGYGSQKRMDVTGAISSTSSALQGKLAGVAVSDYSFGEREFKAHFEKTRKQNLCENKPTKLKAKFRIDEFGRPTDMTITDCDCHELRLEFTRIINQSPNWSEKNKNVELILKIN